MQQKKQKCKGNYTDSWETIIAAVQSGDYPYKVGDTKEVELSNDLGTHTLIIANTTSCSKAFLGGTAVYKTLDHMNRFSEDIDLAVKVNKK